MAERATETMRGLFGKVAEDARGSVSVEEPSPADRFAFLSRVVTALVGAAVFLGLAGFARRESTRPAFSAVALGGWAIFVRLVTSAVLILVCAMLAGALARGGEAIGGILSGILETILGVSQAIGEFFSTLFGGLFGG